ncbi:hypothetical protein FHJ31_17270 [Pseudomonas sp. Fig-3]|nr:hypothetical protein FHJ31_17270 [Pseudomonas sp. Fig-3]
MVIVPTLSRAGSLPHWLQGLEEHRFLVGASLLAMTVGRPIPSRLKRPNRKQAVLPHVLP